MRPGGDLLEIGPADSAGVHAKEDLASADLRDRNCFEPDVVHTAVYRRLHRGRNCLPSLFHDELFCQRHYLMRDCSKVQTWSELRNLYIVIGLIYPATHSLAHSHTVSRQSI